MELVRIGRICTAMAFAMAMAGVAVAKESAADRWVACMLGEVHVQKHRGAKMDAATAAADRKCSRIKLPSSEEAEGAGDYVSMQIDAIYAQ